MDYRASTNAICFGDLKQAALFFDRVISFAFLGMFGTGTSVIVRAPDEVPEEVVASLIYGKGSPGYKVVEYVLRHFDPFLRKISKRLAPRRDLIQHSPYDEIQRLYLQNHCTPELGSIRDDFAEFSKALGFEYSAVALPTLDDTNLTFEQAYTVVSLSGLPLIDVSKASWDQIMQLREDEESASKLRRLRLFVYEKYAGKPRSYIEDDLAKRIEDFERARKTLGFDSVVSTISVVLDSKTLQASATAGLVAAIFGGSAVAIGTAAAVEIGKVSIEIAKRRQAIRDLEHGHDMAFIATARKSLR